MRSPDFENLNSVKPDLSTIKELKDKAFIKTGSPLWWSTDYIPDPRKYLTADEFFHRMVHLGEVDTLVKPSYETRKGELRRDVYLYPEPQVPMSVLELDIEGIHLPFLLTVRPYHPKEQFVNPVSPFLINNPLETLPEFIQSGGLLDIPNHFYPHIRGLFAGRRGNNLFWYPLRILSWWEEFGQKIEQAVKFSALPFLELYNPPMNEDRRYVGLWYELLETKRLVDQKRPTWVDFPYAETSAEEFLESWQEPSKEEPVVFYPQRVDGIDYTLPLVIAAKTHQTSKIRRPVVLGVFADNEGVGRCHHGGICRIKDLRLAEIISESVSNGLEVPVDTVLFTPRNGKPKYERISTR